MCYHFMEWNIHGRGGYHGYRVPSVVSRTILKRKPDIAVLTEFYGANGGWEELGSGYTVYTSPFQRGCNQVAILLRNGCGLKGKKLHTMDPSDPELPEFLRVDLEADGIHFSVLGVRIKTQGNKEAEQRKALDRCLRQSFGKDDAFLCAGDFNCANRELAAQIGSGFSVQTPEHNKSLHWTDDYINNYSYFFTDRRTGIINGMRELDHMIVQGLLARDLAYSWEFIGSDLQYPAVGEIKRGDTIWDVGDLPDHALLLADIELPKEPPASCLEPQN